MQRASLASCGNIPMTALKAGCVSFLLEHHTVPSPQKSGRIWSPAVKPRMWSSWCECSEGRFPNTRKQVKILGCHISIVGSHFALFFMCRVPTASCAVPGWSQEGEKSVCWLVSQLGGKGVTSWEMCTGWIYTEEMEERFFLFTCRRQGPAHRAFPFSCYCNTACLRGRNESESKGIWKKKVKCGNWSDCKECLTCC